MKRIVRNVLCMSLTALVSLAALAQSTDQKKKDRAEWKEKVQAERVAYLTTALELSVEESEAFWPVYNKVQKDKSASFKDVAAAMGALKGAIKEGKSDQEIEVLLQSYLDAREDSEAVDKDAIAQYKKVLPVAKIAKLFVAEEQFRHQQIKRLNKDDKPGEGGNRGPRDGQQRQMRDGQQHRSGSQSSFRGNRGWNEGQEE